MGSSNSQLSNLIFYKFLEESSRLHIDIFMNDQNFLKIIQKILTFFTSNNDEHFVFGRHHCFKILKGMIDTIPQNDKSSLDKMNSYASTIIERVVQNIKNETVLSIIDTNYEMIYNLIKKVV